MAVLTNCRLFLGSKLPRVIEFFASQGLTMAGNLFYGFLCVRLLPIPEYAKYAVVYGFLGTMAVLMDIGFSTTLLPLVGERIDDRQLIADYLATLRQLAHWLFLVVAPAAIIFYPVLVRQQHWNWRVITGMLVLLLLASWFARVAGAYGAVLIVCRARKEWYRAQMLSSFGTLVLLVIVWAAHALNALDAILINILGAMYVAYSNFSHARRILGHAGRASREKRNAIVHIAMPSVPNAIFYAFQGQIALLLITVFGRVSAVASVGALGRLAQIFVLFSQMTPLLIEPYFARLPSVRLKRNYIGVLTVEAAICIFILFLVYISPSTFLWILGHKYSGLNHEVFLLMAASAISYFSGIIWSVHNARRFVYWWNTWALIVLTLATQTFFIFRVDLSNVSGVLILNLATASVALVVNLITGIYGFVRGPRKALCDTEIQPVT